MADTKVIAASILNFLKQQIDGNNLSPDYRESVEVAVQCLETAFEVGPEDCNKSVDLVKLVKDHLGTSECKPEIRAEADQLRNEGNELMKAEKYKEALEKYTKAIKLDPFNAVYFCNRAAAHSSLGDYEAVIADCTAALGLQPDYSKAYGRLGLAFNALGRHREAKEAYTKASQLEPNNELYKRNLQLFQEQHGLSSQGDQSSLDLGNLLQNPALINMASEMLSDPNMQNLISGLMTNSGAGAALQSGGGQGGNMSALLEAGQALAQHMQSANPELVDQLRRQMGARPPGDQPPQ